MSNALHPELGGVVSLWRYPVKSMMGEELQTAQVKAHGVVGDRVYALRDSSDGKIASAKNPSKWPTLFAFRTTFLKPSGNSAKIPSVSITLPDGKIVTSEQKEVNQVLSTALNRQVTLIGTQGSDVTGAQALGAAVWTAKAEEYLPEIEGLDHRESITDFALPMGTFFDCAMVHLLTTSTLTQLQDYYPKGSFAVQRFRPNLVVDLEGHGNSFA